mgnify:CR=1 FL=1
MLSKKINLLMWSTFLIISLFSCKDKNETPQDIYVEIPEDFVEFYDKFHSDTIYQIEHIHFPLEGIPAMSKGTDLEGFSFWWERDGWKYHKPFDAMDGTFTRDFSNFAGIITETIRDNSGQFTMVRRFSKMDGEWKLIFYKQLSRG